MQHEITNHIKNVLLFKKYLDNLINNNNFNHNEIVTLSKIISKYKLNKDEIIMQFIFGELQLDNYIYSNFTNTDINSFCESCYYY